MKREITHHDEIQPWLGAFLDGEVDQGCQAAIEKHLSGCPICRKQAADLRGLSRLLALQPLPETLHHVHLWPLLAGQLAQRPSGRRQQSGLSWLDWLPPAGLFLVQAMLHGIALTGIVLSLLALLFGFDPLAWLPLETARAGVVPVAETLKALPVQPITSLVPDLPAGLSGVLTLLLPSALWLVLSASIVILYLAWLLAWRQHQRQPMA